MRRADARSAQIGGPDRIAQRLQVSTYSIEPNAASLARNLLSKHRCRSALGDESEHVRPEVTFIRRSPLLSGNGERLTGTASRPNFSLVWPVRELQCIFPAPDPSKEMHTITAANVLSVQMHNAPSINCRVRK
jgi:hypothetical protein